MASAADSQNSPLNGKPTPAVTSDDGLILPAGSSTLDTQHTVERPAKRRKSGPQRVRTGCHTCRERHLKCDEALHRCQNCRKSGRVCRRGVRLNFIDTQIVAPPCYTTRSEWIRVTFRDDSRLIASEYVGGLERYPPEPREPEPDQDAYSSLEPPSILIGDTHVDALASATPLTQPELSWVEVDDGTVKYLCLEQDSAVSSSNMIRQLAANSYFRRIYLNDRSESSAMRSAVTELGCWIDALDAGKHVCPALPCRYFSNGNS